MGISDEGRGIAAAIEDLKSEEQLEELTRAISDCSREEERAESFGSFRSWK